MKQMKLALVAIMAVLMGTTFTSCLDSDNGPRTFDEIVNIDDFFGAPTITSDNGYKVDIQNVANMKLKDGSFPERAMITCEEFEGEDYTPGKSSYKALFSRYSIIFSIGEVTYEDGIESLTPINSFFTGESQTRQIVWGSGKYLNFYVVIQYDEDTDVESDIILNPFKVENGVLYCKVIHKKEVTSKDAESGYVYMSYPLPSKTYLQSEFEGINFTGEDKNIIEIVLIAEGKNEQELKTEKVQVAIPE